MKDLWREKAVGEMGCLPWFARENSVFSGFKNGVFAPVAKNNKTYLIH
jgi:hypothetical protein